MPATIGDAFTLMGNAALQLVGRWDQLTGASAGVAAAIIAAADALDRLAAIGLAFGAVMAGRWVAGLIAARLATASLSGALLLLRGAILRTGIGALIVGAGELIYRFGELVQGAGGFGNALALMGDVAQAVWEGIKASAASFLDSFRALGADVEAIWLKLMAFLARKWAEFLGEIGPTFNAVSERIGAGITVDWFGAAAQASMLEHAASNAGTMAGRYRQRAADTLAGAFDGVGPAVDALRAAMAGGGEADSSALDDAAAAAARVTEALDAAGGAARGAGAAGRAAGTETATAAEEAVTGWRAVTAALADHAEKAREIGGDIGASFVGAFRSAETAIGEFVKTGRLDFRDLVTSMIADLAQLASRRFILGPLANALSGALGGVFGSAGGGTVGNLFASVLHAGGIVGEAVPGRMVPTYAFARAPRLHQGGWAGLQPDGGWAGLAPDEVPAILQRGERVLSRRELAAHGRTERASPAVNVTIFTRDAESFRQSRTQVAADIARAVSLGRRGL
jgi:hypothetical protein